MEVILNNMTVTPERGELTIWFLIYWTVALPVLAAFILLAILVEPLGFGIAAAGWFLFMIVFIIWMPAFFRTLEYNIDSETVRGKWGVFWRKQVTVPYRKITNVDVTQGPVQRKYGIGTIHIQTAGYSANKGGSAELKMLGVKNFDNLKDTILQQVMALVASSPAQMAEKTTKSGREDAFAQISADVAAIRDILERDRKEGS